MSHLIVRAVGGRGAALSLSSPTPIRRLQNQDGVRSPLSQAHTHRCSAHTHRDTHIHHGSHKTQILPSPIRHACLHRCALTCAHTHTHPSHHAGEKRTPYLIIFLGPSWGPTASGEIVPNEASALVVETKNVLSGSSSSDRGPQSHPAFLSPGSQVESLTKTLSNRTWDWRSSRQHKCFPWNRICTKK